MSRHDRDKQLAAYPGLALVMVLALAACSAPAPAPRDNRSASPVQRDDRSARPAPPDKPAPGPAAKTRPGKPLDAPCAQPAECMPGLTCGPRPKGEWEDAPPAGKVCRGTSCELGEDGACPQGSVCCPLLTGIYGPYCLLHCRGQGPDHCRRLLDHADAVCNAAMGCCHIPKVKPR
jgi:hypothetical protein